MALIRVLVLLQLLQQGAGAWGAAPAIEATGNDVVVSTPSDGKILFRIGDADAIDLKKLVDKVADLELRLQVATDNIALNSQRQTKGEWADTTTPCARLRQRARALRVRRPAA